MSPASAQAIVAGTANMTSQNEHRSVWPRSAWVLSTTARASTGSAAAMIIVPYTRCSRCGATADQRASGNARCSSRFADARSPRARCVSASRWSECASPAGAAISRWRSTASRSSRSARSRSPASSAASPTSAVAKATARSAPARWAVTRNSSANEITSGYGVVP